MKKLNAETTDLAQGHIEKMRALFPECVTESEDGLAVDFDALRQELSSHLVEGPQERYRIDWPGKRHATAMAYQPTSNTLRPIEDESVAFDSTQNLFIEGDNLEALKLIQETYLGKVKMIYIDPPYNTGNDFIYRDDFKQNRAEYEEASGQRDANGNRLVANPKSEGRFHSDWLSMIYPRLKLARNLLADDGVIFISIDDGEVANLRRLCDEVYGAGNFLGQFVWETKRAARGVPPVTMVMHNHEYVVAYFKNTFIGFGEERNEEDFGNPDNDRRGLWRSESIRATGNQNNSFKITDPDNGNEFHGNWAFSEEAIARMMADALIIFPSSPDGTPRQKKLIGSYRNERKAIVTQRGWFSTENSTKKLMNIFNGKKIFDFPKPLELLQFLIKQAARETDYVLDFFAGSAP
ncbi:MAG: site-specific DNA-methyltransferase, partial [Gammaproteobacteria bacterium]